MSNKKEKKRKIKNSYFIYLKNRLKNNYYLQKGINKEIMQSALKILGTLVLNLLTIVIVFKTVIPTLNKKNLIKKRPRDRIKF